MNVRTELAGGVVAPLSTPAVWSELASRVASLEQATKSLVPPGFESFGRFAGVKRNSKRVIRRLVWWYVEPRWEVQRALAADSAAIARLLLGVAEQMTAELDELRDLIDEVAQRLMDEVD